MVYFCRKSLMRIIDTSVDEGFFMRLWEFIFTEKKAVYQNSQGVNMVTAAILQATEPKVR